MKLTPKQARVLKAISDIHCRHGRYPDHYEIAVECGKTHSAADWAHDALRRLSKSGLIVPVGKASPYAGRSWKITANGTRALPQ